MSDKTDLVGEAICDTDGYPDRRADRARPAQVDEAFVEKWAAETCRIDRVHIDDGRQFVRSLLADLPARPESPAPAPGEPTGATCAFQVGDRVRKVGGDYSIDGTVRSVFAKESGAVRLVVEAINPPGLLHIYSEKNLERIGGPTGAGLTVLTALALPEVRSGAMHVCASRPSADLEWRFRGRLEIRVKHGPSRTWLSWTPTEEIGVHHFDLPATLVPASEAP